MPKLWMQDPVGFTASLVFSFCLVREGSRRWWGGVVRDGEESRAVGTGKIGHGRSAHG